MTVEAFILVKSAPGKSRDLTIKIAAAEGIGKRRTWKIKGVKKVYRATGEYDIIVHASSRDTNEIFAIADKLAAMTASPQRATLRVEVIILGPKKMGDP